MSGAAPAVSSCWQATARRGAGACICPHGTVETPAFMPVGTYGTVKGDDARRARGARRRDRPRQYLSPDAAPGHRKSWACIGTALHGFMGWQRPILTDSGGFQVFSLASLRQIDEDGVRFHSPVDGARVHMRPEDAMDVQRRWARTLRWHLTSAPAYPATHGAGARVDAALDALGPAQLRSLLPRGPPRESVRRSYRAVCTRRCASSRSRPCRSAILPGYAIGGLAVGETEQERLQMLDCVARGCRPSARAT